MPCAECGESVAQVLHDAHTCDPERLAEYRMFQLRDEVAGFEAQVAAYLDSPRGRFELWDAARRRALPDA